MTRPLHLLLPKRHKCYAGFLEKQIASKHVAAGQTQLVVKAADMLCRL